MVDTRTTTAFCQLLENGSNTVAAFTPYDFPETGPGYLCECIDQTKVTPDQSICPGGPVSACVSATGTTGHTVSHSNTCTTCEDAISCEIYIITTIEYPSAYDAAQVLYVGVVELTRTVVVILLRIFRHQTLSNLSYESHQKMAPHCVLMI